MNVEMEARRPPDPPPFERRILVPLPQMVGIPVLLLLPILATLGVFGETKRTAEAANEVLALEVTSPARTRFKMLAPVTVEVTNLSARGPVTVTLEFSSGYIQQFSQVRFSPGPSEVTPERYRVEVPGLSAGEARVVTVDMQAERYWRHRGRVGASLPGGPPVSLPLETWVFP
jgi:hypothetical protein